MSTSGGWDRQSATAGVGRQAVTAADSRQGLQENPLFLCSWFVFSFSLSPRFLLCVRVSLGKEWAAPNWSYAQPVCTLAGVWRAEKWPFFLFFFFLSWKLLFSRHSSSPSSGYTGSILRTPLRKARCGSELGGQRRALDRDGRGILMVYHQVICFVLYRWSGKSLLMSRNHTISLKSQCFRCSQWTKAIWCFLSLNIF